MSFPSNFNGKKCLVTGAGRGIWRAIVGELIKCDATIYALSRTPEKLKDLKSEFPTVFPICVDVSNWEEVQKSLEPLDVFDCLINNAGVCEPASFFEISEASFDRVFNINLKSVLQISQIVAKKMIEKGQKGSIINMSSICSKSPLPKAGIYPCSKAGLNMLTKIMAVELGPHKIRVNSVNPALVETNLNSPKDGDMEIGRKILDRIPTKTFQHADERCGEYYAVFNF